MRESDVSKFYVHLSYTLGTYNSAFFHPQIDYLCMYLSQCMCRETYKVEICRARVGCLHYTKKRCLAIRNRRIVKWDVVGEQRRRGTSFMASESRLDLLCTDDEKRTVPTTYTFFSKALGYCNMASFYTFPSDFCVVQAFSLSRKATAG